jgi:hypothetical protein
MRFRCRLGRVDNRLLCILRRLPTVVGVLVSRVDGRERMVPHQIRGSRVKDNHKRLAAYT